MVDYWAVIQVGLAILIMIGIGFGLTKGRVIDPSHLGPINQFLFKVCFIPLIAKNLMYQNIAELKFILIAVFILASICSQLVVVFTMLIPTPDRFGTFLGTMLPAVYVNYIIIGLPIFTSIWPGTGSQALTIITMSNDLFTAPVYLIMTAAYQVKVRNKKHKENNEPLERFSLKVFGEIGMRLLTSPIIEGYIVGFFCSLLKIKALVLDELVKYLGETCLPMSCLCVGGFLAQHSIVSCKWWEFTICMVVRHIVFPIFAGVFASVFKLSAEQGRQCMIGASLPSAVASYLLSTNAGVGMGIASTMIFWTNFSFLVATVLWFVILDGLKIFVDS